VHKNQFAVRKEIRFRWEYKNLYNGFYTFPEKKDISSAMQFRSKTASN